MVALDHWRAVSLLIKMTLGTDQGKWWADETFGSRLWIIRQSGKVDDATVSAVRAEILRALDWMVADGIFSAEPVVEAWKSARNRIDYKIQVPLPDGSMGTFEDVWYGL